MKKHNLGRQKQKKPDWREWLQDNKACQAAYSTYLKKGILRLNSPKAELYLRKATHNLDFGAWISDKHKDEIPAVFGDEKFFDWAVTCHYYAIYHAALALVASKGLHSKSHLGTLCALILHFYHEKKIGKEEVEFVAETVAGEGVIGEEDINAIIESKGLRERASYNVGYEFEQSLVSIAKENAVKFIEKAKSILSQTVKPA